MQPATIAVLICFLVSSAFAGHHKEDNGPAYYKFEYGVKDHHTGDIKSQHEHAEGKELHGGYMLKEPDGTTRVVKYHADHKGGFDAVVERIGHAQHPAHYGKHGKHGGGHGGQGGTSYVGVTHYGYHKH